MSNIYKKLMILMLVAIPACLSLTGCETMEGAGEDIENAGDEIEDATD